MNKYKKALDYINKSICTLLALHGIQDEQVIKNLHIFQEVVDKATPKKPIRKRIYYNCHNGECDKTFFYYCPVCNFHSIDKDYTNFCPNCGQKIDWSNE